MKEGRIVTNTCVELITGNNATIVENNIYSGAYGGKYYPFQAHLREIYSSKNRCFELYLQGIRDSRIAYW